MITASGSNVASFAGELVIATVVALIGAVIAYLLGRNGAQQQMASTVIVTSLNSQTDKLDSHGKSLIQLQTSLGPAVIELELHQIQLSEHGRDIAVLKEWRTAHDAWSKETIDRLERGIHAQRRGDGP